MSGQAPELLLTTSPHLKQREDTSFLMWQVNIALVPVLCVAVYYFGLNALLLSVASIAGALLPEWVVNRSMARRTLKDGSALITGILLALTLPPTLPLWMGFVGGMASTGLGKWLFGGIGYNLFNPALVGRAFLQAAFPEAMTFWTHPSAGTHILSVQGDVFAYPFLKAQVDGLSAATPLAQMKFDAIPTGFSDLLMGSTGGSLGETGSIIILLCGIYLVLRRVVNWRIPVALLGTVAFLAFVTNWIDAASYASADFHLFSGGLMLGAVFMATDPVTSPVTQRGAWVFGIGIGVLVMVIRLYGGLPEGVMYAILLMNAVTPLINRVTQARVYGTGKS